MQTGLTSRQKAAVIVRLLLNDESAVSLSRLNDDSQTLLAEEMSGMGLVDRHVRDQVILEFCDRLEAVGMSFPGNLDETLTMLDGQLSSDSTDRLRRQAALAGRSDPWARLADLPTDDLLAIAQSESPEMVALMLSRLPVDRASGVFTGLPRDLARIVAQTMSLTGNVTAQALNRVGLILLQAAETLPRTVLEPPPAQRIGALLNSATADLRDDVLEALDAQNPDFAGGVRKAIFIFAHLPTRLAARDVPRVVREVDQAVLLRALTASAPADAAAVEYLLSNLSQRMADTLRDELSGLPQGATSDIESAMNDVVAAIRALAETGEITLIPPVGDAI